MSSDSKTSLPQAFKNLWASSIASNLSDGLLRTVVPIYAITLTESPILISLISAMTLLPWLFFAVIVGTIADRVDRKKLMVYSTVLRTLVVAAAATAISAGVMTIYLLLLLMFIAGACEVSIDTTAQSMIPQMLENDQLEKGNSRLYVAETVVSQFIGAPISGFLYAAAIALPFFASTLGYIFALGLIILMPYQYVSVSAHQRSDDSESKGSSRQRFLEEMKFGITYLIRDQRLRQLVVTTTALGFLFSASHATIALYMVKDLALDPRYFGIVLAIQGVGGVVGGLTANRLSTRFGRGHVLSGSIMLTSILIFTLGFVPNIELFTLLATLSGLAGTIWNILLMSTYQVLIPNELYGRIHGARRTIVWGLMPIGAFLGGVIATVGLQWPFLVCGALSVLVALKALPFITKIGNSTIEENLSQSEMRE